MFQRISFRLLQKILKMFIKSCEKHLRAHVIMKKIAAFRKRKFIRLDLLYKRVHI